MFARAGKVTDSFLPMDRCTGKKRGFGFVRFRTVQEALTAVDLTKGRSWGGRRINVNMARSRMKNLSIRSLSGKISAENPAPNPWFSTLKPVFTRSGLLNREGWITSDGPQQAVRVAPWVIEEEKKVLQYSLVWFLKIGLERTKAIESWLDSCWGEMAIRVKMLDE